MRRQDLFHLCTQNLLRKKTRTFLTALGVLIGCCSIVITVSLGVGMKETQEKALSELGDLTIITVNPPQNSQTGALDDHLLQQLREISGVKAVTPKFTLDIDSVTLSAGPDHRYVAQWTNIVAMDVSVMETMGYRFLEGSPATKPGDAIIGQYMAYNLKDTLRPEGDDMVNRFDGDWDGFGNQISVPAPYLDPIGQEFTLEVKTRAGVFSMPLHPVGVIKEDYSKGNETVDGVMISLDDLRRLLGQADHDIPISYDSILVKTSSISQVSGVEGKINAMGYPTESMESVRKPLEKEAQHRQMTLGSLGAISLFVAALGIINTMIMSISERTREIGIMKSLGCPVSDIRIMFLAEAGAIGFIGGVSACVISVIISAAVNFISMGPSLDHLIPALLGGEDVARISVIPPWLLLFAVLFSVLIGLGAGCYPANKAVRISVLEAIKSE